MFAQISQLFNALVFQTNILRTVVKIFYIPIPIVAHLDELNRPEHLEPNNPTRIVEEVVV